MLSILHKNAEDPQKGVLSYGMPPFHWAVFQDIRNRGNQLECVGGHVGRSALEIFSELDADEPFPFGVEFVPFTIMRDSNESLVSFWAYLNDVYNTPNRPIETMLKGMLPNSMYLLLAPAGCDPNAEETTMGLIKDAMKNSFSLVGLIERFDETLLLLKRKGILDDITYRKHKVLSGQRSSFDNLDPAVQQQIIQHNRLDQELFDYAKELFEETLKEQDASFWEELEEFKQDQQKKFEELGECEDDPKGGWICDSEVRRTKREERERELKKPEKPKDKSQEVTEDAMGLIHGFVFSNFKPRYW